MQIIMPYTRVAALRKSKMDFAALPENGNIRVIPSRGNIRVIPSFATLGVDMCFGLHFGYERVTIRV